MGEQIKSLEDAAGKTVAAAAYTNHPLYADDQITLRFTDGSFLHVTADSDGCGEAAELAIWRDPTTPEAKHAAGLIDAAEFNRLLASRVTNEETRARAEYERLKARFERQPTESQ